MINQMETRLFSGNSRNYEGEVGVSNGRTVMSDRCARCSSDGVFLILPKLVSGRTDNGPTMGAQMSELEGAMEKGVLVTCMHMWHQDVL